MKGLPKQGARMKLYVDKRNANKHIKTTLSKNNACYILITCNDSSVNGEKDVEMSYQGDIALASYLLQGAQLALDEQFEGEEGMFKQDKITPIS